MKSRFPVVVAAALGFLTILGKVPPARGQSATSPHTELSVPEQTNEGTAPLPAGTPADAANLSAHRIRIHRDLVWFDDIGAYQGVDRRRHLDLSEFYQAVGRQDLAAKTERERKSAAILMFTGGALLTGGVLWLMVDVVVNIVDTSASAGPCFLSEVSGRGPCQRRDWVDTAPVVAVGAGALILLTGAIAKPRPPTPENARALARAHNRALLGGASPPSGGVLVEMAGSIRVAPKVTSDGIGMVLVGRF